MRCALIVALSVLALPAWAQEDDELPALPSAKPKPKPSRAKPKPKPKPAPVADDDLPALPQQKSELLVKLATPLKGAKLIVDDKEVGVLPQPAQVLTPGEHTVLVRRLGFAPFSKKVTVAGGKASELAVTLEPTAAVLTVSSDVAGAQVFINGRLAGKAPLIDLEVPPGSVDIAVKKDGYHDGAQTLSAKAGRDYPIEVKLGAPISESPVATRDDTPVARDLRPEPVTGVGGPITGTEARVEGTPVYQRWWFWAAAVAVVGGIAVASVVGANAASGPAPLRKADFNCNMGMGCDGWINEPAAIVPIGGH